MSIKPLVNEGPTTVPGFSFSGMHAGIKKRSGVPDLALILCTTEKPAAIAGIFTENLVKAAPVRLGMERLKKGQCRAVLINSGNANACTGEQGDRDAIRMAALTAKALSCPEDMIQVGSTGVIGAVLPMAKIENAIPTLVQSASATGLSMAAKGICTTDTYEKMFGTTCKIGGKTITICGIAKGSGMISPCMATMLGYIMTDLAIGSTLLQEALREAAGDTFNAITVDGEMSTNDTLLILANGAGGNSPIEKGSADYSRFLDALRSVCDFLARQIVRDGEGSNKFVELRVSGLEDQKALRAIAMAIANSPLVKTAWHGEDANWGRILSAAGACAARLHLNISLDQATIQIGGIPVFESGRPLGAEAELKAQSLMKKDEFTVDVTLTKLKSSVLRVYTTDLTKSYIDINAGYRS